MKTAPCTWDVLVTLTKIGGNDGVPQFGGVPVGRSIRGFLTQESLDPSSGLPAVDRRMETTDMKFSSSEVQYVLRDGEDKNKYVVATKSGRYGMVVHRRNKIKKNI